MQTEKQFSTKSQGQLHIKSHEKQLFEISNRMYVTTTDLNEQFTNRKATVFNKMWTTYLKYTRAKQHRAVKIHGSNI